MDMRLSAADRDLRSKARDFTEQVLMPLEHECEEHDGLTPGEPRDREAGGARLAASTRSTTPNEDGGQGLDLFQQMLVEEQWGTATGALWDIPWRPSIPLAARHRGAEGAVPAPGVPRRAARRVRDHRGGRRLGPVDGRDHRAARRRRAGCSTARSGTSRRATSPTSSCVHAHVDGDPGKADRLPRRQGPAGRAARAHAEVHAHVRVRAPDLRVRGRARRPRQRARRGRRRATSSRRTGSSRSG